MRLVVRIFALQNRSKTSRPVVRTTGLNLEAFVRYSDYKIRSIDVLASPAGATPWCGATKTFRSLSPDSYQDRDYRDRD